MNKSLFDEVIRFAIENEQRAAETYAGAAAMVKQRSVREMLLGLASQERGHKAKLEGLDLESMSESSLRRVPDLRLSDYMDDEEMGPDMDYQDVLTLAIKREEKAHNLYSALASNTESSEMRKLFELLAREEAGHKLVLEREYDDHVLTDN